jgi:hypothetical protein
MLLCFAASVWAQEAGHEYLRNAENALYLQQLGNMHESLMLQWGYQQQIRASQEGNENRMILDQVGEHNGLQLSQQGNHNVYSGGIRGHANQIQVQQEGNNNRVEQLLIGNDMHYRITQRGSRLEVIQEERDGLAPSYQVEQWGRDMRIHISNGINYTLR